MQDCAAIVDRLVCATRKSDEVAQYEREWQEQQQAMASTGEEAMSAFKLLVGPTGSAGRLASSVLSKFKNKVRGNELAIRAEFLKRARSSKKISKFVDATTEMQKRTVENAIMNNAFGWTYSKGKRVDVDPLKGEATIRRAAEKKVRENMVQEARTQLYESGYVPDVFKLFPNTFGAEVAPDGRLLRMIEVFGNKGKTAQEKAHQLGVLIQNWKDLVTKLKADLTGGNERKRLMALVALVVAQTGIRGGKWGEGKTKAKTKGGKELQTYGALTLLKKHVKFVRKSFVRLEFTGKWGTVNVADLKDKDIVNALSEHAKGLSGQSSDAPIFVTKSGKGISHDALNAYFKKVLKQFVEVSDFRKLRATRKMYDALKKDVNRLKADLLSQLGDLKAEATEQMKQKAVEIIVDHMTKAAEATSSVMSHESIDTTIGSYINPLVIMEYLNSGGKLDRSLEDIFAQDGKSVVVRFDPVDFIKTLARAPKKKTKSRGRRKSSRVFVAETKFEEGDDVVEFSIGDIEEMLEAL